MDSLLGFLIGVASSFLVSYYFHVKSKRVKKLIVVLDNFSKIIDNTDTELNNKLSISYNTKPVQLLYEYTFSVINIGNKPIRDVIDPLTFYLSDRYSILDVKIISVDPDGRSVELIRKDEESFLFKFPLLNSKERFSFKVLLSNKIKGGIISESEENVSLNPQSDDDFLKEFTIKITSDELPPIVKVRNTNFKEGNRIEYNITKLKLTFNAIGAALLLLYFTSSNEGLYIFDLESFLYSSSEGKTLFEVSFAKLLVFFAWMTCLKYFFSGIYYAFLPSFKFLEDSINKKH